jgi:hypothetical protein
MRSIEFYLINVNIAKIHLYKCIFADNCHEKAREEKEEELV